MVSDYLPVNRPILDYVVDLVQEMRRRRSVWIVFGSSGSLGFADKLSCFAKRRQIPSSWDGLRKISVSPLQEAASEANTRSAVLRRAQMSEGAEEHVAP
jgi:hypothetical protein